ncbi:uncharacterized protein LOC120328223 [Styela clava]
MASQSLYHIFTDILINLNCRGGKIANMKTSLVIAVLVFVCCTLGQALLWGDDGGGKKQKIRDCKWVAWSGSKCFHIGNGVYKIKQTRRKIPAKNGGAACKGSNKREIDCTPVEYTASAFFDSFTAGTDDGSTVRRTGTNLVKRPDGKVTCQENSHTDPSGTLRMMGKTCGSSRKRRETGERVKRSNPILSDKHRDVLFLVDESGSVNENNFKREMKMAKALTEKLCGSIAVGKHTTRVGVMTFDKENHVHLGFDELFERHQVLNHMKDITYNSKTAGRTCLTDALDYSLKSVIVPGRGARNKVPGTERVVVLITDGCANCRNQNSLPNALNKMRIKFEKEKIPFITFFIGSNTNCVRIMAGLADGSRCYQVFRATTWQEFDAMIEHIEKRDCMDGWEIGPSCPA